MSPRNRFAEVQVVGAIDPRTGVQVKGKPDPQAESRIVGSIPEGITARAHLSPLHTPVPLAHHTSTKKNEKQFSQKYFQKKIISRINFIQTFPTNYSTKLSRFFLCLLDTMCLVHPHFLTVHLQTSHSISM